MNLLQKLGLLHNIEEYAFVEYTTNSGCGVIAFARHIGNTNFRDLNSKETINASQITYKKPLANYINKEQHITDGKAKILAKPFYGEFHKEWLEYYTNKPRDLIDNREPIPFCVQ